MPGAAPGSRFRGVLAFVLPLCLPVDVRSPTFVLLLRRVLGARRRLAALQTGLGCLNGLGDGGGLPKVT